MIQVALDGSGPTHGFYAYAGVVGSQGAWVELSRIWTEKLRQFELPYLRMTEAMNFTGCFHTKREAWGTDASKRRDDLLAEFAALARVLDFRSTGLAMHALGFREEQQVLRKRELFQDVVKDLLRAATAAGMRSHIALMCDTEQDAADYFRKWLDNLRQRDEESRRIAILCFGNSKVVVNLQLADMVAYLLREEAERSNLRPTDAMNPLFSANLKGEQLVWGRRWRGHDLLDLDAVE